MENLDVVGEFWKADDPGQKITGRFTFDSVKGGELNLEGCFFDNSEPGIRTMSFGSETSNEPIRILGNAGGRLLTLYHCHRAGMSGKMGYGLPSYMSQRYIVQVALSSGVHFSDDRKPEFKKVQMQFNQLEHWIGMSGIDIEEDSEQRAVEEARIVIRPLQSLQGKCNLGELELSFNYSLNHDFHQSSIKQTCVLTVMFEPATSLDMILGVCAKLQNLLMLCRDSVAEITDIELHHADVPSVKCYNKFIDADILLKQSMPTSRDFLLSFIQIGELAGVAKWLDTADMFDSAIGALMSRWYTPNIYIETHFFNAVTAAETLERLREKEQKIDLKQGLLNLARIAGATFAALVGDINHWASEVVETRVLHVVHRGLRANIDARRVYFLSESLYFLAVLCLLQECGIANDTLQSIQANQRFIRIKRQLQT